MMENSRNLTVSGLVALIQDVVESNFVAVTVEGEISNFAAPSSGHWYFTLKDSGSQLRGVMFRGRNRLVERPPRDGEQVICSGTISVYPARGEMQMVVDSLVSAGKGSLQAAFEALKERLAAEGLFAAERKRPLPAYPRAVGIVTSPTGAAIHDLLKVLERRAPDVRVLLRPVRVQGDEAAVEIATAIADLNRYGGLDVLIVGRGGGSLEDLWAFNEEVVARAIATSELPVISAVGHEVDFTIADFVADLRAPTPSAAAELVAKNRLEREAHLDQLTLRLQQCLEVELRLVRERLGSLDGRLRQASRSFALLPETVAGLEQRLSRASSIQFGRSASRLAELAGQLATLSPLAQLDRGYVIASRERDDAGVTRGGDLSPGDRLWLRFAEGRALTRVEEIEP